MTIISSFFALKEIKNSLKAAILIFKMYVLLEIAGLNPHSQHI